MVQLTLQIFVMFMCTRLVIISAINCEHPFVRREVDGHFICCRAVSCSPGHEIKKCLHDREKEECVECPDGLVQNFYISSYQDENERQCISDNCKTDAGAGAIAKSSNPTLKSCNQHCVCNVSAFFVGSNPCACYQCSRQQEFNCSEGYYLDETADTHQCACMKCRSGYEKNWVGPGPCKPIGPEIVPDPTQSKLPSTGDPLHDTGTAPTLEIKEKKDPSENMHFVIVIGVLVIVIVVLLIVVIVLVVVRPKCQWRRDIQSSHSLTSLICKIIPDFVRCNRWRRNIDSPDERSTIYAEINSSLPSHETTATRVTDVQPNGLPPAPEPPPYTDRKQHVNPSIVIAMDPIGDVNEEAVADGNTTPCKTPGDKPLAAVPPWQKSADRKLDAAPNLAQSSDVGNTPPIHCVRPTAASPNQMPHTAIPRTELKTVIPSENTVPKHSERVASVVCPFPDPRTEAAHYIMNAAPPLSNTDNLVNSHSNSNTNLKSLSSSNTDLKTVSTYLRNDGDSELLNSSTDLKLVQCEETQAKELSKSSERVHPLAEYSVQQTSIVQSVIKPKQKGGSSEELNVNRNQAAQSPDNCQCNSNSHKINFPSLDDLSTDSLRNNPNLPLLNCSYQQELSHDITETDSLLHDALSNNDTDETFC